jgi:hypothetical protein
MLTNEQLRRIGVTLEEACQIASDERGELLHHLLDIARLEVRRRIKAEPLGKTKAA